jgi:hypothetical protein
MAATVEICESNGAGETISHNVSNINLGSADAANLDPVVNPLTPGNRSYIKYLRLHVTAMGGSSKIDNLKVYRSGTLNGTVAMKTNCRTSSYGGALTYATPTANAVTGVDQDMVTSAPASANLGIGGVLNGSLSAAGYSDYAGLQVTTGASDTQGTSGNIYFSYDETQ